MSQNAPERIVPFIPPDDAKQCRKIFNRNIRESGFLGRLPIDVRVIIYDEVFKGKEWHIPVHSSSKPKYPNAFALFQTCRQLYSEARLFLFKNGTFVFETMTAGGENVETVNPMEDLEELGVASDCIDAITKISIVHPWYLDSDYDEDSRFITLLADDVTDIEVPPEYFKQLRSLTLRVQLKVPCWLSPGSTNVTKMTDALILEIAEEWDEVVEELKEGRPNVKLYVDFAFKGVIAKTWDSEEDDGEVLEE